jgi:hypothetical protein
VFIPSALVQGPDRLLHLGITDHQEPPTLHIAAARCTDARLQDLSDQFIRHPVGFKPPHQACGFDDLEQIGSARGFLGHLISFLFYGNTRTNSLRPALSYRKLQWQQNRFGVSFCAVLPASWHLRETWVRRLAALAVSILQSADLSKGRAFAARCFRMAVIGCCCAQMAFWNKTFELHSRRTTAHSSTLDTLECGMDRLK